MKPFDLEAAKAGKPVCTRDGKKARILCTDLNAGKYTVVAAVDFDNNREFLETFTEEGYYLDSNTEHEYDLMMPTERKKGWINIYHDRSCNNAHYISCIPYPTEEKAIENSENTLSCNPMLSYIGTFPFEWEE